MLAKGCLAAFVLVMCFISGAESDCKSAPEAGKCRGLMSRYFYNTTSSECEKFMYGGCGGNDNNYMTLSSCNKACSSVETEAKQVDADEACAAPRDGGMCLAYMPRYYYDAEHEQCISFVYGGCGGNANNYKTEADCLKTCHPSKTPPKKPAKPAAAKEIKGNVTALTAPHCKLPKETGPCRAFFQRYYYNKKSSKCEEFVYGGCGGNKNNFMTKDDCMKECAETVDASLALGTAVRKLIERAEFESICLDHKDPGPCSNFHVRYYWNLDTMKCEPFAYGGCEGNDNNFESQEECDDVCLATLLEVL